MAEDNTDSISLREARPADAGEQHHDTEQEVSTFNQAESKQWETDRKRAGVLVGSAISQFPIWGFAMSYGVLQQYFYDNWTLKGGRQLTGIIGTTQNGVMYISMPFLFAMFTRRYAHWRQRAAFCGAALTCVSFILSSFSKDVWHLIATQGVLAALGCALVFSPLTLSLSEWFNTKNRICNRAVALGIVLSSKNIVGSTCPFIFRALLDRYGFRLTLRIWAAIALGADIASILLIPTPRSSISSVTPRSRKIPWKFLRHQTFYIYSVATLIQSAGYGIPQSYVSTYARDVTMLSQTWSTLLLTLINIPGIASSSFFGYLSDNKYFTLSPSTVTAMSAVSSALSAFLFWGLTSQGGIALLILFSITFGFFASGYSATWGGVLNELEREAAQNNEAIDAGTLYGLLNGARGIGYVGGGLLSIPLLNVGSASAKARFGYGTPYGPLIIFTGLSLGFGGWGVLWKWKKLLRLA